MHLCQLDEVAIPDELLDALLAVPHAVEEALEHAGGMLDQVVQGLTVVLVSLQVQRPTKQLGTMGHLEGRGMYAHTKVEEMPANAWNNKS